MLVLSRKLDQDIVIGDNIRVRVLKIKGNTIRLGIDAPRDIKVVRGELDSIVDFELTESVPGEHSRDTDQAEVTIVFNNGNHADNCREKRQVIPFQNQQSKTQPKTGFQNRQSAAPPSVHFREKLPATLQHNRLKELVKDLTRGV